MPALTTNKDLALLAYRLRILEKHSIFRTPQVLRKHLPTELSPKVFPDDAIANFFISGATSDVQKAKLCLWHILWEIFAYIPGSYSASRLFLTDFPSPLDSEKDFPELYVVGEYLGGNDIRFPGLPQDKDYLTTWSSREFLKRIPQQSVEVERFLAWRVKKEKSHGTYLHFILLPEVE
jgi:hypothetical protein